MSGQSLYRNIKEFLVSFGIDISDFRGQGYDGAGAVSGKNQGLSAHVLRVNPKALYTLFLPSFESGCSSLLWRKTCSKPDGYIKEISNSFNLPVSRKNFLEDKILLYSPES